MKVYKIVNDLDDGKGVAIEPWLMEAVIQEWERKHNAECVYHCTKEGKYYIL